MDQETLKAVDFLAQLARQVNANGEVHEQRIVAVQKVKSWLDLQKPAEEVKAEPSVQS